MPKKNTSNKTRTASKAGLSIPEEKYKNLKIDIPEDPHEPISFLSHSTEQPSVITPITTNVSYSTSANDMPIIPPSSHIAQENEDADQLFDFQHAPPSSQILIQQLFPQRFYSILDMRFLHSFLSPYISAINPLLPAPLAFIPLPGGSQANTFISTATNTLGIYHAVDGTFIIAEQLSVRCFDINTRLTYTGTSFRPASSISRE